MSPFGPREKQALLEAQTLEARARVLTALLDLDAASTVAPTAARKSMLPSRWTMFEWRNIEVMAVRRFGDCARKPYSANRPG